MYTLAIANHKGGVGKTTTAANLGAALAERGRSVLLVDMDPQGSLSAALGVEPIPGRSMADVLGGAQPGAVPLRQIIERVGERLHIAPASLELAVSELGLTSRMGRESVLKKALRGVSDGYDLALIDCPPSLGLLTINGLTAADAIIAPTLPKRRTCAGWCCSILRSAPFRPN